MKAQAVVVIITTKSPRKVKIFLKVGFLQSSLVAQMVKHLSTMQETWVRSLGREDPLEKEWQPTPVLLPGKSHGQRSLVGYSPSGRKESDMTERLHFTLDFSTAMLKSRRGITKQTFIQK